MFYFKISKMFNLYLLNKYYSQVGYFNKWKNFNLLINSLRQMVSMNQIKQKTIKKNNMVMLEI